MTQTITIDQIDDNIDNARFELKYWKILKNHILNKDDTTIREFLVEVFENEF